MLFWQDNWVETYINQMQSTDHPPLTVRSQSNFPFQRVNRLSGYCNYIITHQGNVVKDNYIVNSSLTSRQACLFPMNRTLLKEF